MRGFFPAVAIFTVLAVLPAQAEKMHPMLEDRHTFILGAYYQKADAEFYADARNVSRKNLGLGDLGLDEQDTSWIAEYRYRLNDDWLFALGAYTFDTSGSRVARTDFVYDGVEYEAGARVDSRLEADTYIVEAMYRVYHSDRSEIYLGGGLHIFDFSTELETGVFIGEQDREAARSSSDILAPLPNVRAQGFYAITPRWGMAATLGWFSLTYEEYDGSFSYLNLRTTYRFSESFGLGLGYQYVDIEFEVEKDRGDVGLDAQFTGPVLQLAYSF